jgi:hypothetical protein
MNALDDDLLEEAKQPSPAKKHKFHWYSVAVACFFLVIILQFPFQYSNVTAADLHAKGYDLLLPEDADNITYSLNEDSKSQTAQAIFSLYGDEYTYQVTKCTQPASDADLTWTTKDLDLSMRKTNSSASINWYSSSANTSHTISTSAGDDKLLSTARQVLLLTGLDIAHAPAGAENIQYYVFSSEDLVVAETTFSYEDNVYSYRMAATLEIAEDFADISEMNDDFSVKVPGDVEYCRAKISFTPGESGKIIWFDVVPGIVYSLSTDDNASEETLLRLANELFEPMQGNVE